MGKNVAVFVDVANIFYAAKAAGVDIDYVTLLKSSSAGRDLVRAYAYTGLDPDNENQRNFHSFLARHGYKVVSKDIRKYGDGKVKANLDIELVVDMMKTARNLDIAIVVSGDGDFAPAIRAVQEQGVRVEVISFRGNTSSDLIDVADQFTDITAIAKVDKSSTKSGRRVAGDEEDLSMTEVPDKQTEGSGRGRGRTGRTRTRTSEPAVVAAGRTGGRERAAARSAETAARATDIAPITILPGERLARAGAGGADETLVEEPAAAELDAVSLNGEAGEPGDAEGGRRRRRRRGGRGRGRGRGAEGATPVEAGALSEAEPVGRPLDDEEIALLERARSAEPEAPSRARRQPTPFGSVWDSQIGLPAARQSAPSQNAPVEPIDEDEFEEPEIPEYLISERNRQRGGPNRGGPPNRGRGGRGSAYAAALDRERFGGGRGSTMSRFVEPRPEPQRGRDRDRGNRPGGGFAPQRRDERPMQPRPSGSAEPWSEVPPELEAMLRAQLSGGQAATTPRPGGGRPGDRREGQRESAIDRVTESARPTAEAASPVEPSTEPVSAASLLPGATVPTPAVRGRRTTRSRTPEAATTSGSPTEASSLGDVAAQPTARRRSRSRAAASDAGAEQTGTAEPVEAAPAPRRRATRARAAGTAPAVPEPPAASDEAAAPKRRTSRARSSATAAPGSEDLAPGTGPAEASADAAPKRRAPRRSTTAS